MSINLRKKQEDIIRSICINQVKVALEHHRRQLIQLGCTLEDSTCGLLRKMLEIAELQVKIEDIEYPYLRESRDRRDSVYKEEYDEFLKKKSSNYSLFNVGAWTAIQFIAIEHKEPTLASFIAKDMGISREEAIGMQNESDYCNNEMKEVILHI